MVVAGVFLKSNYSRIVTLSGTRKNHCLLAKKVNKLDLPKNPVKDDVEVFSQAFKAFCVDNAIDKVVVNRRATSGQGAGGAGTFLIEGVLLAISPAPIEFVHSATIRATERKQQAFKSLRPATADLGKAYDLAFEGLS
jgi:hypothetical protein